MSDEQGIDYEALRTGAGPKKKPAPVVRGGIDYDALAASLPPATGQDGATPAPALSVAPVPTPTRGLGLMQRAGQGLRAIGDKIGDLLTPSATTAAALTASAQGQQPVTRFMQESREEQRLKPTGDTRTPAIRAADARAVRRKYTATIQQRPDATMAPDAALAPVVATQEDAALSEGRVTDARHEAERVQGEANFTPAQHRDLAVRGHQHADELERQALELQATDPVAAEALHQRAEIAFRRKADNHAILANAIEKTDSPMATGTSALLGPIADPYAGQRTNLATAARGEGTFTPEEVTEIGRNTPVANSKAEPLVGSHTGAMLLGSLPWFVTGDALLVAGAKGAANAVGASHIAEAIARALEIAPAMGPAQAGVGGAVDAIKSFARNAPTLTARGATVGQVPGAAMAAREAQQRGENPVDAAVGSVVGNLALGPIAELAFGALGESLGVIGRSANRLDYKLRPHTDPTYGKVGGLDAPPSGGFRPVARAIESAREVEGKTALADKTVEGQHATIAEALSKVLDQKIASEPRGEEVGQAAPPPAGQRWWESNAPADPMIEPGTALRPRGAEDVPLRTASEIANKRAGTPRGEADAVVQMERARRDADAFDEHARQQAEQVRIEQAAATAAREKQGPLTAAQTIARAGRDADAGDQLALDYKQAINDHVDALARVQDAGEKGPTTRDKIAFSRTMSKLNELRAKYGAQAGGAALVALASQRDDLTDNEKRLVGLGALTIGSTALVHHVAPNVLRELGSRLASHLDETNLHEPVPVENWGEQLRTWGVSGNDHVKLMEGITKLDANGEGVTGAQVQQVLQGQEQGQPLSYGFRSRLRTAVENMGRDKNDPNGKIFARWDVARPAGDWIGKLKGGGEFSQGELTRVMPALEVAQQAKRKLTRAEVLDMVDLHAPQFERVILADPSGKRSATTDRVRGDEIDFDDLTPDHRAIDPLDEIDLTNTDDVAQQVVNRRAKVQRLNDRIESETQDARETLESHEEDMRHARDNIRELIAEEFEHIGGDTQAALDAIDEVLGENIEGGYVPHRTVEKAYDAAIEKGELYGESEPRDPSDVFDIDEHGVNEDGSPAVTIRVQGGGGEYTAPTLWEAVAKAEQAGDYQSGSKSPLFPDSLEVAEVRPGQLWRRATESGQESWNEDPATPGWSPWARLPSRMWNKSDEEVAALIKSGWGDHAIAERHPDTAPIEYVIVKDGTPTNIHDTDREAVMQQWVDYNFEAPDTSDIKSKIDDLASAMASHMESESTVYDMEEGEHFNEARETIEQLDGEADTLTDHYHEALDREQQGPVPDEGGAPPEAFDPYGTPLADREVKGRTNYGTYQRIAGGTDYAELPTTWTNAGATIPSEMYGSHDYWGPKGIPNAVGHIRRETHELHETPGITGEKIEHFPDDSGNVKALKERMTDTRGRRNRALRERADIERRIDTLPMSEVEEGTRRAYNLKALYEKKNQQITDLAKSEDTIAAEIRNELDPNDTTALKASVMLEAQTSLSQHQAGEGEAIGAPPTPEHIAELRATIDETQRAKDHAYEAVHQAGEKINETRYAASTIYDEARAADDAVDNVYNWSVRDLSEPLDNWSEESVAQIEKLVSDIDARHEGFRDMVQEWRTAREQQTLLRQEFDVRNGDYQRAQSALDEAQSYVDIRPFDDIATSQMVNMARHLIDTAERGDFQVVAFSDAANRIRHAMSTKPKAARQWYGYRKANGKIEGIIPNAMLRTLGAIGFKDVKLETIYIKGESHWAFKWTPEMQRRVRQYGVPGLAVLGMVTAPDDAEAQDGKTGGARLYGSAAGVLAAGALITAMASNRKLRGVIKENRVLSRALHLDDLSGLANGRAHRMAIESIDRDPNTAWIAMDADMFKRINDVHGHGEGDKAIQHFGNMIRTTLAENDVPVRAFRSGGDEFPVAVPKERAGELLRALEEASPYTKGDVTTKLTGAIGNTWGEADALLIARKAENRGEGRYGRQGEADTDANTGRGGEVRPGGRAGDEGLQPYTQRSVEGDGSARVLDSPVRVVAQHAPDPSYAAALAERGRIAPPLVELAARDAEAYATFHQAISQAKADNPYGAAVYVYPPTEYAGMRLFTSESGKSGFALKGTDIVSVFSTEKGGVAAHALAIAQGGKTLDAFDTVLPRIYAENGMRVVSRLKWDETQRPPDWNKATFAKFNGGEPDVVFMVHDPAFTGDRLGGEYAKDYDHAVELQQAALRRAPGRGVTMYSNPIGPALRELKRYPSAAGIVAVGYAMGEQDDNKLIQRAGVPVMALGALSAIGSKRLYASADFLGSKLVNALAKSSDGADAVRMFNPDALLAPDVKQAIRDFEAGAAKGKARAAEFAGKMKKLGPEGDRAVSDVLENEEWEGAQKQTAQVLAAATSLAMEYDKLTKAQLAAGTLKDSQILPNYGGPRRYAFYDAQNALADSPSGGGGASRSAKIVGTKSRTLDIPIRDAEATLAIAQKAGDPAAITAAQDALDEAHVVQMSKRQQLGEIRESSYRASIGIEKAHANVASAKLFETLRSSPGAVHPEWQAALDDLLAAKDMFRTATTQADRDAADLMQKDAGATLDEIVRRFKKKDGPYVSLPDTPGMGMLRGAVVQRDIAHSLEGFDAPQRYGKMLRAWKEIKTVFNVGTHVGNVLSNVTALHMGHVPVWLQPYYYTAAFKDLSKYGEATRALTERGVMNVNSITALGEGNLGAGMRSREGLEELLPTTSMQTQKVLRENGIDEIGIAKRATRNRVKGMATGAVIGAAKTYDPEHPEDAVGGAIVGAAAGAIFHSKRADMIRKLYGHEDNIARIAVFLRRRKLGDTVAQATDAAVQSLGDFRSRSPALRVISSTISPFIMYQAKAVPAFARNVVDHPWKYLSLMAAWGAMNELGQEEQGEVPESDIPLNQRRDLGYFFPGFTQLTSHDEQGNKAAVDMSRYTPISGLTTGAPPGSIPEAFSDEGMSLVTPGGPAIDAGLHLSNLDPYTKGPLIKRDRPTSENVGTLLNKAADFVLPSSLGFHATRLKEDMDNEDWTKFKNDLYGPAGIKPKYVRPGAVAQDAEFILERSLRDMKQELRHKLRANKNEERVPELTKRYTRDVAQALVNFRARVGVAPSPAITSEFLNGSTP